MIINKGYNNYYVLYNIVDGTRIKGFTNTMIQYCDIVDRKGMSNSSTDEFQSLDVSGRLIFFLEGKEEVWFLFLCSDSVLSFTRFVFLFNYRFAVCLLLCFCLGCDVFEFKL